MDFHAKIVSELRRLEARDEAAAKLLNEVRRAIAPNTRNTGYTVTDDDEIEVKGWRVARFGIVDGKLGIFSGATLVAESKNLDEATTELAKLVAPGLHKKDDDDDGDVRVVVPSKPLYPV